MKIVTPVNRALGVTTAVLGITYQGAMSNLFRHLGTRMASCGVRIATWRVTSKQLVDGSALITVEELLEYRG